MPDGRRNITLFEPQSQYKIKAPGYFSCLKCYYSQLVMFSCTEMLEGNLSIKDTLWQIFRYRTHTIHWRATAFKSSAATLRLFTFFFLVPEGKYWTSQICSGLYKEISKRNHTITLTGSQLPSRGKTFQIQAPCVIQHHPSWHKERKIHFCFWACRKKLKLYIKEVEKATGRKKIIILKLNFKSYFCIRHFCCFSLFSIPFLASQMTD